MVDITTMDVSQEREYALYHDVLTGLDNRNSYAYWLKGLQRCSVLTIGIAFFNIDCLKKININFGFSFGDDVIKKHEPGSTLAFQEGASLPLRGRRVYRYLPE